MKPAAAGRRRAGHGARPRRGRAVRRRCRPISRNATRRSASCRTCCAPMRTTTPSSRPSRRFYNDLMLAPSGLSKLEREMIAVVVSSQNRCYYCLTAHGAAVRQLSGDPVLGEMLVHELPRRGARAAPPGHARLRREAHRGALRRSRSRTGRRCARPGSRTATSGTSPRSPPSSTCRTGWRRPSICARTGTTTGRRGRPCIVRIRPWERREDTGKAALRRPLSPVEERVARLSRNPGGLGG